jgi:acetyl-coA hydrolase
MSKGGKSIIVLPSTTGKGFVSRIMFTFDEGVPVTISRNDVDYVITEYGIAHLDFREELRKKALEKFGEL